MPPTPVSGATVSAFARICPPSPRNAARPATPQTTSASGTWLPARLTKVAAAVPSKWNIAADSSIYGKPPTLSNSPRIPYEGTIWDRDGNEITFKDEYRIDFLTDRAEKFLRAKQEKPFLLVISQLEPHQQNDLNRMVGPKGSAERFINAYVPPDLRAFPGDWHEQLPDYYGACESIDASVGRLRKILDDEGIADNTIFVFMSDHGCHFMTRNQEYKRSTHNSSLRVPLVIHGPGFETARQLQEVVGIVSIAPTLLDAAGIPVPDSMKGRSLMPLIHDASARQQWPNSELVQISESMTGRAIRTKDWTYCVADPTGVVAANSTNYHEYQMYDQRNDPHELVNLAGRKEYRKKADELRAQLTKLIVDSGEPVPQIEPAHLYP